MAQEIEYKYLVKDSSYKDLSLKSVEISQGYLSRVKERTVRVRTLDDKGFLTIKGCNNGAVRAEFEYEIPLTDAQELLGLCERPVLSKTRYYVRWDGHLWEVDEFQGDLAPLVTAEIELRDVNEKYTLPPFVGEDVTHDPRYYNSNLSLYGLNGVS